MKSLGGILEYEFNIIPNSMKTIRLWLILIISGTLIVWLSSHSVYQYFQPVHLEQVSVFRNGQASKRYYIDLDKDGEDEVVQATKVNEGLIGLSLVSGNHTTWQENFDGFLANDSEFAMSDIDGDSLYEVVIVYFRNDSLFLGVIEFKSNELLIQDRFISTIKYKGKPEEDIHVALTSFDFDKDGRTEVVVNVSSGYGLYPRKLFIYHPSEDRFYGTPDDWQIQFSKPKIFDFNGDGVSEIWISGYSPGNSPDTTIKYHDHKGWGMLLDDHLNLYPSEISRTASAISLIRSKNDFLLRIQDIGGSGSDWFKMNFDGKRVNYDFFKRMTGDFQFMGDSLPTLGAVLKKTGFERNLFWVGENLNTKLLDGYAKHDLWETLKVFNQSYLVGIGSTGITLVNEAFEPSFYPWSNDLSGKILIQEVILESEQLLCLQNDSRGAIFRMTKINYSLYRSVALILVFLAWVLLGFGIHKFYLYQKQSRLARLYRIQMQALRNQINPHFALNLMSSIRLSIMKEDVLRADELLDKFTKILRYGLDNSDQIEVELWKEIEQIRTYLELEMDQCDMLTNYEIDVPDLLKSILIPKMLIHEHVENAIKHGIRTLSTNDGLIVVRAFERKGKVFITIEDNGNGIKKLHDKPGAGRGLKLTEELIEIFNKLTGRKVSQRIEDLPRGTKVTIIA